MRRLVSFLSGMGREVWRETEVTEKSEEEQALQEEEKRRRAKREH